MRATPMIKAGNKSTSWRLTGKADTLTEGNESIVIKERTSVVEGESVNLGGRRTINKVSAAKPTVTLACAPA